MTKITPQLIEKMAIGITGIVMQHTERDDLAQAYVHNLSSIMVQVRDRLEKDKRSPEARRQVKKVITILALVDEELERRANSG